MVYLPSDLRERISKLADQDKRSVRATIEILLLKLLKLLWSFADNKGKQQWVWLAIDVDTREIVGVYIGDCSATLAIALRF